ncbi:HAMP domain-containing histidine kinase [Paenibacillus sp. PL2-23]|uniref:HAMP domain-containing sensor histidine kinase n=1 Tax=Paenibacillus sp. PL2-23 TaxID=2100729 RepID=UPI0030F6338E
MRTLLRCWTALPFHWKQTIYSALLLSALVLFSNVTQYMFVDGWMTRQEEQRIQRDMKELLNVLLAKEVEVKPGNETELRLYMERANVRNGMIRLLSASGDPIMTVADNVPAQRIGAIADSGLVKGRAAHEGGMLVMRSPITIFSFQGTIEMARSMEEVERLVAAYYRIMFVCCAAALLLSGVGGSILARGMIRPLRSMNAAMRRVKQQGLHQRMPVSRARDEIASLQLMFNEMMDQVEESFHKQQRFVEDASHELRTPLAIVEGHLRMLSRWGRHDPNVTEQSLGIAMEELERLKKLVDDLLLLSRAGQDGTPKEAVEGCERPLEVVRDAVKAMSLLFPQFEFRTEEDDSPGQGLRMPAQELSQVIRILLDNAVKYSGDGRLIKVRYNWEGDSALLSVEDEGIGIPEEELPRLFDRFYRVDKARTGGAGGYGLGLSIAKSLVENNGGEIAIASVQGQGTKVAVVLPGE